MAVNSKFIFDVVHGTIALSPLEHAVVKTLVFQRLRNIKQLGLAHLIYPSADYSRLSHSIGVCHAAGLMATALKEHIPGLTEHDVTECRLAGLLHDIGHLPFSHALERALQRSEAEATLTEGEELSKKLNRHEAISGEVIEHDRELSALLRANDIDPARIRRLINREAATSPLTSVISSDLDADRLDYLLRTAKHTGLPYGSVDLPHLISCLRYVDDRVCLQWDGLRGAEHFLLGRFFDYQRVAFHRRVAGWEQVLEDVIGQLIERRVVECSSAFIRKSIADGSWHSFDDAQIVAGLRQLRRLADDEADDVLLARVDSILDARPPECIAEMERVELRANRGTDDLHNRQEAMLREKIATWSQAFDIAPELWYVWASARDFTGAPAAVALDTANEDGWSAHVTADLDKSIWVLDGADSAPAPLVTRPNSIFKELANAKLYRIRLYVLLSPEQEEHLTAIRNRVRDDCQLHDWTGFIAHSAAPTLPVH